MKHHKKGRTLGRERGQRVALLRSLAESLIDKEKITTTEARAKELRPFVEKLITSAKKETVASRRLILARLGNRTPVASKLFSNIGPRFKNRAGGYTRITKLPPRLKDSARMARIELIEN